MRFTISLTSGALIAAFQVLTVVSLGINCRGSGACGLTGELGSANPMTTLRNTIVDNIDPNRYYSNGEQIACGEFGTTVDPSSVLPLCVFCQNSNGAPGHSISTLIQELVGHGCATCGSIPLFYPGDNNDDDGELTVNTVSGSDVHCSKQYNIGMCA